MTYYGESSYPTWYRNWVDKEMTWRYNRHMVVGPGIYLNTFAESVTQMQYARDAGRTASVTYSYRDTRSDARQRWDWYPYVAANFFTATATVPTMPWRSSATATEGTLWGRVTDAATGNPIDDATVQVGSMAAVKTDANGYYVVTLDYRRAARGRATWCRPARPAIPPARATSRSSRARSRQGFQPRCGQQSPVDHRNTRRA